MFSVELLQLNTYLAERVIGNDESILRLFERKLKNLLKDYYPAQENFDLKSEKTKEILALLRFILLEEACRELDIKLAAIDQEPYRIALADEKIKHLNYTDKTAVAHAKQFIANKMVNKQKIYKKAAQTVVLRAKERGEEVPALIRETATQPITATSFAENSGLLSGNPKPDSGCCVIS
jgi:hypothetical protein